MLKYLVASTIIGIGKIMMTTTLNEQRRSQLMQQVAALQESRNPGQFSATAKLPASNMQQVGGFGYSVAISGDRAIVGAWDQNAAYNPCGAAYIFQYQNGKWSATEILQASDSQQGDQFGHSVAIIGDRAIVGAKYRGGAYAGAAYIFQHQNGKWSETEKLQAFDIQEDDRLGYSLAISGDRAIVATWGEDASSSAVYIFQYRDQQWLQTQKLTIPKWKMVRNRNNPKVTLTLISLVQKLIKATIKSNWQSHAVVSDLLSFSRFLYVIWIVML